MLALKTRFVVINYYRQNKDDCSRAWPDKLVSAWEAWRGGAHIDGHRAEPTV